MARVPGSGTGRTRAWRRSLARALSIGLHPFVVAPVLACLAAAPGGGPGAATPAVRSVPAAVVLLLVMPLGVLTWWQGRRGAWATVDVSRPRDRAILFGVTLGALLALGLALTVLAPASPVTTALSWVGALVGCCALLTRWIKLSLHQLSPRWPASCCSRACRPSAWGCSPCCRRSDGRGSRVALDRHRWSEVLVGTAVGALAGLVLRHVA